MKVNYGAAWNDSGTHTAPLKIANTVNEIVVNAQNCGQFTEAICDSGQQSSSFERYRTLVSLAILLNKINFTLLGVFFLLTLSQVDVQHCDCYIAPLCITMYFLCVSTIEFLSNYFNPNMSTVNLT